MDEILEEVLEKVDEIIILLGKHQESLEISEIIELAEQFKCDVEGYL